MLVRPLRFSDGYECVRLGKLMHAESKYAHIPFSEDRVWHMMYAVAKDAIQGWCVEGVDLQLQGLIAISTAQYYFSELITASDLAFFVPERDPRIAFALMNAAETWCQQNGIHSLTLGVTAPVNTLSVGKVYERKGYTRWGEVYRKEFV